MEIVTCKLQTINVTISLRTADVFPVVASQGREATTGNTSAVRRLRNNRL